MALFASLLRRSCIAALFAVPAAHGASYSLAVFAQESIPPKWIAQAGHPSGYCPALLAAIEKAEPRLHFTGADNIRSLMVIEAGLEAGSVQVGCALLPSPRRYAIAQTIGRQLYTVRHRLAAAANDDVVLNSVADLVRLKPLVNTARGAAYAGQLKQLGIAVDDSSGDSIVNLKKTIAGHGRFTYMNEQTLAVYLQMDGLAGKLRMLPLVLREEPVYFWMSKKTDPAAVKLVDRTLANLRASGELARLYERWMKPPTPASAP